LTGENLTDLSAIEPVKPASPANSRRVVRFVRDTWRKNGPEVVAAATGGLPRFVMSSAPRELEGIPVFCYHQVSAALFQSHLRFLRDNGYRALTADELLSALSTARDSQFTPEWNARRVVITFDDGLMNLHDTVFPLLREYGTPVVAFIAPAFHATRTSQRGSDESGVPTCSWRQIEAMHASGLVDFQSHTFEHRLVYDWPRGSPLSGTSDSVCERFRGAALALEDDLARAREVIEQRLGKAVHHLAFPQYDGTRAAIRIGRACGYKAFYWGVRARKATNAPGDDLSCIVRLSGEFLPRLPGRERVPLRTILRERYARNAPKWWRALAGGAR
jgi:peptidoglycan/xylan/chitin deacetylase (PgdA/CDA1 family)